MMKTALNKLMLRKDLTSEEVKGIISDGVKENDSIQLGAILALLHAKGETVTEVAALVEVLKGHMIHVQKGAGFVDIVGTGGDQACTVNISTGASLLASACGARVAKHGNRAISSSCGSADVLEKLGIPLLTNPSDVEEMIRQHNYGFMFAPAFHPLLKELAPIRKKLGVRTSLNLVGPLVNPADVDHYLLGVYRGDLMLMYAKLLIELGVKRSIVVHGHGTDELTTLGSSKAILVDEGQLTVITIDPARYGMQTCSLEDLKGGDAEYNASILERVFSGEQGPISDTIILNAGVALFLSGYVDNISEGVKLAQEKQRFGDAMKHLDVLRSFINTEVPCDLSR